MPYINRKCNNCGKEYYVCYSCIKSNSWKNVCCSRQCFREYIKKDEKPIEPKKIQKGEVNYMYGKLKTTKKRIRIVGYDLELNRYDDADGNTYSLEDFIEVIISSNEFEKIIND